MKNETKSGPSEELYDMAVDVETTIKEVKKKLNEIFILGELEANQYLIHTGGEQEDKERKKREHETLLQIYGTSSIR